MLEFNGAFDRLLAREVEEDANPHACRYCERGCLKCKEEDLDPPDYYDDNE